MFIRLFMLLLVVMFIMPITRASSGDNDRFKKIDAQGREMEDSSSKWDIVLDSKTGLYWEVKSIDESIHSNSVIYNYAAANDEFVKELNESNFGRFSDWRLPTEDEMFDLKVKKKGDEVATNLNFFPNTRPARYMAHSWCGSRSEYQEGSVKFGKERTKGGKYVRAVRGKPLE